MTEEEVERHWRPGDGAARGIRTLRIDAHTILEDADAARRTIQGAARGEG